MRPICDIITKKSVIFTKPQELQNNKDLIVCDLKNIISL